MSVIADEEKTRLMSAPDLLTYDLGEGVLAFSSRRGGGVSQGLYASFNVNAYCGDDALRVLENRRRLADALQIDVDHIVMPHQTHGVQAAIIDGGFWDCSAEERRQKMEGVDALITTLPHVCIGVSTADCIPVLCLDPIRRVVAAIHAGWRGTVEGIVGRTIERMQAVYGTCPSDLRAVIGPGISLEAFEVGDEVYAAFAECHFPMNRLAVRFPVHQGLGEKWHIDLWEANRGQLTAAGVPDEQILCTGICTYTHYDEFFSARRLGIDSGRIFNGIMLTK